MLKRVLGAIVMLIVALAGIVAALNFRGEERLPENPAPFAPSAEQVKRGE